MSKRGDRIPLSVLQRRAKRLSELVSEREQEERDRERKPSRTGNRARFEDGVLVLPGFSLYNSGGRAPWRAPVVASFIDDNGTKYEVQSNRTRSRWWASASKAGMRMSNTASTGSKEVAEKWIEAVQGGNVRSDESRLSSKKR